MSEGELIVCKLDDGEDLFASIERLIDDFNVSSGIIVTNIGMLRDVEINFFRDGRYEAKALKGPMELVAMHGSIAVDGSIHIHCALADEDHAVHGGHLTKATVAVLNEIVIRRLDHITLGREYNERSGLKETTVGYPQEKGF